VWAQNSNVSRDAAEPNVWIKFGDKAAQKKSNSAAKQSIALPREVESPLMQAGGSF